MKTSAICRTIVLCSALFVCALYCGGQDLDQKRGLVIGDATNGIRAELEVVSNAYLGRELEIILYVNEISQSNFTTDEIRLRLRNHNWKFYQPTNDLCGVVEIRTASGRLVPVLRPGFSSLTDFVTTYSLEDELGKYLHRFNFHNGPNVFPIPLMAFSPRSEALRLQLGGPMQSVEPPLNDPFAVGPFSLGDYFDIEEPGEYAITVWPKVYKRDATNSDVCHRIDLPPVSAKFKWSGSSKK